MCARLVLHGIAIPEGPPFADSMPPELKAKQHAGAEPSASCNPGQSRVGQHVAIYGSIGANGEPSALGKTVGACSTCKNQFTSVPLESSSGDAVNGECNHSPVRFRNVARDVTC
mmetsp:Transcript_30495/g.98530  ORF Transcript_30495/g.98530 Transcript_30495/m.98530 type:complete len:114 (-) Transcript_30495:882-1223(-)